MKKIIEKDNMSVMELFIKGFLIVFLFIFGISFFIRARNMAAVCSTVADMKKFSTAISQYIKDHGTVPTNPHGPVHRKKELIRELMPYIDHTRCMDWWGYSFNIWTGPGNRVFGFSTKENHDFIIASFGKDGNIDSWSYNPEDTSKGGFFLKKTSDFEKDIILMNGEFVRAPFFVLQDKRKKKDARYGSR